MKPAVMKPATSLREAESNYAKAVAADIKRRAEQERRERRRAADREAAGE